MGASLAVYASMQGSFPTDDYVTKAIDLASDCERLKFTGALVHFNHRVPDPWLTSSLLIQNSTTFVPMVAVQPYYTSPFALAKMIATVAYLHQRRVALNMVAGSTPGELHQVCDRLDHDDRFRRMDEYLGIVRDLLADKTPLDRSGQVYEYANLNYFAQGMDQGLQPDIFIAGSSEAAMQLSARHDAVAVTNPTPFGAFSDDYAAPLAGKSQIGVRIGLIARETREEAWEAAKSYFPPNRAAQINVKLHGRASDSVWRRRLSDLSGEETHDGVYWLGAILAGGSHSPFLVGSYTDVSRYLARYIESGVSHIILASPWEEYERNSALLGAMHNHTTVVSS